ncbi:hypothetical protein [Flavobacterium poyangense]|uniref:hypothetical protein n=1 Tax=Flavobacterium poyangense TaxID=2204302 RepID=UPI001422C447|nr:hypothetical protein [Flavobacterium sp. JXAS1]
MSLKEKSEKLKELISTYDAQWLLGDLSSLIHSGRERAPDQLGKLSSPMRQLYYLAGLCISTNKENGSDQYYNKGKWDEIVKLLNEIENEYFVSLIEYDENTDAVEWKKVRGVAIPSFLSYFNQGPLNFEEQIMNWVIDLFTNFDTILIDEYGLRTNDFILFYESLDKVVQNNFQGFSTNPELLRKDWDKYTKIKSGMDESLPDFFRQSIPPHYEVMSKYMIDNGMKDRFYPEELVTEDLSLDTINKLLEIFSIQREERSFLYYTETNPGNPLYDFPILDLENGMYQVFEVKQVIHSINNWLEKQVTKLPERLDKYLKVKGKLLENNIIDLFKKFLGDDVKVVESYFIDGCEQDILIIWKDNAFIIEAKGYNIREPFRNPEKAFTRIKDDFKKSIGYGYEQTLRVETIILEKKPLVIQNNQGKTIETIDTAKIKNCFSIIVNINSFGLVQNDLSYLLNIQEDDIYPWAVKYDDLEIFILTLIAQEMNPQIFIDFLLLREELHGKITCSDELEICGGFLTKQIIHKRIKYMGTLKTSPEFGDIFDQQYNKTMGFKNEKNLYEKQSGKYMFW